MRIQSFKRRFWAIAGISVAVALSLVACVPSTEFPALTKTEIESARQDLPQVYETECYASYESSDLPDCDLKNPEAKFHVYLVGDSHAAHWSPAIEGIADEYGWKLTFHGKRSCSFSKNEHSDNRDNDYPSCATWNENLQKKILEDQPDVVITANYSKNYVMEKGEILERGAGTAGEVALAEGMLAAWVPLVDAGIELVIIRDTPYPGYNSPDCLIENLHAQEECKTEFAEAVESLPQPELLAAEKLSSAQVIDLNQTICKGGDFCSSLEGEQVIYRDKHHFTATYASLLQVALSEKLAALPAFTDQIQIDPLQ